MSVTLDLNAASPVALDLADFPKNFPITFIWGRLLTTIHPDTGSSTLFSDALPVFARYIEETYPDVDRCLRFDNDFFCKLGSFRAHVEGPTGAGWFWFGEPGQEGYRHYGFSKAPYFGYDD